MPIHTRIAKLAYLGVVAATVSLAGCRRSSPNAESVAPAAAEGVVTSRSARFLIPVGAPRRWRWNLPETTDNYREYAWDLAVAGPKGGDIHFGFSLFKFPGNPPGEGSLAQLLDAGQASVWEPSLDGGGMVGGLRTRVESVAGGSAVAVIIDDRRTLEHLFASRPASAELTVQLPGEPKRTERVPIRYADW